MNRKLHCRSAFILLLFSFLGINSFAQNVFWSDNFNNGCTSNCIASTYNGWTITDNDGGTTGGAPNNWFISCAEEGIAPPGCGSSCIGDASLHVGANPGAGGDMGASFNETGINNATYRMAVSPIISTVGISTITLKFDFIAFGSAACSDDRVQLRLSADGGATWPAGFQTCLTSVCCGACNGYSQGQWTLFTLALPAIFDNNPNVRIGFHWLNNGNGVGTDPSAAIDDIQLSTVLPLPVTLVSFDANKEASKIKLKWVSVSESNLKRYDIERATEALDFQKIGSVAASGKQLSSSINYSFYDIKPLPLSAFYRLKMVDIDGKFSYSKVVRVLSNAVKEDLMILTADAGKGKLHFSVWAGYDMPSAILLYDLQGKKISEMPYTFVKGVNEISLKAGAKLAGGHYIIKIASLRTGQAYPVLTSKKFLYSE